MLKNYERSRKLVWQEVEVAAFEKLKEAIGKCSLLFFYDSKMPVHLYTDASKFGMGAYVCQRDAQGKEYPIGFMSKKFNDTQRRWSVPEKECFAIVAGVEKFSYLLHDCHFWLHTDHANLTFIRTSGSEKVIRWKLSLQEYMFDLVHVKGVDNGVADFMSRNEEAAEDEYEVEEARQVSHLLAAMRITDTESLSEEVACDAMVWEEGSIPTDRWKAIASVHNATAGHHGQEATMQKLLRQVGGQAWPYMRAHVRRFIRDCPTCQKMTPLDAPVRIKHYTVGTYQPMERLAVDTMGPFESADEEQNRYCFVIIDCFTRFLTAYPTRTLSAQEAATALLNHCALFGTPCELVSDRGPEYVNAIIAEFLELLGTEAITTVAYSKEENSIVERANKEINRWLRDILQERKQSINNWWKFLPYAIRLHNASVIESVGSSPAKLVFGERLDLERNIFLSAEERPATVQPLSAWVQEQQSIHDLVMERAQILARQHQAEKNNPEEVKPKKTRAKRISSEADERPSDFATGTYVLVDYPGEVGRPHKLMAARRGPFRVMGRVGNAFRLMNLVTGREEPLKQIHLLRAFHYDPEHTDPATVALADYPDQHIVDHVERHTGRWKYKKSLKCFSLLEGL